MKNEILVRRKNSVFVKATGGQLPDVYVATALKNLASLGFTFTEDLIQEVRGLHPEEFTKFYTELVSALKKKVGANVVYTPMYPNFPTQVMEASEAELYLNAIFHYLSVYITDVTGVKMPKDGLPTYEKEERFPLLDNVKLKPIKLAKEDDFNGIIRNLIAAKTSISESDKQDINWAIQHSDQVSAILPAEIPLKENVGFVVATLMKHGRSDTPAINSYFKTATDVLRLAVALSEGDVSLAETIRFRKFNRRERRLLLNLLNRCSSPAEDMLRYPGLWETLGEILHPGEYKSRYKKAYEAFEVVRDDVKFQTFRGKVEVALVEKDINKVVNLLGKRPGDFARRLDHVLRLSDTPNDVVAAFAEVAGDVSTPVLLQVRSHFLHRNDGNEWRVIFPKGRVANIMALNNNLPQIETNVCERIVSHVDTALIERFKQQSAFGKVYVDETLKNYLVPFSQRSAQKAMRTLVRGSRIPMPAGDTLRFFLYWKEGEVAGNHTGRVDIDLSAVMYDQDFKYLEHISYTNLRSAKYQAAHSGDITSAPNGASEFIDLDIPSILKYGGRYVVASINSFTGQSYSSMPECFAGWMARQAPKSGEIYEPSTVQDKIDITSDTKICIPVILDLVTREVIWVDGAINGHFDLYNVECTKGSMALLGKAMTSLAKPTLYELFELHAKARGTIVKEKEQADMVFSVDEGLTPFDIETIMAEYLA